jgi:hypothetical protein
MNLSGDSADSNNPVEDRRVGERNYPLSFVVISVTSSLICGKIRKAVMSS